MSFSIRTWLAFSGLALLTACQQTPKVSQTIQIDSLKAIALGEMLFTDTRLSANNQIACASCHQYNKAFTDGISLSSIGLSGKPLQRNAPTLWNIAFAQNGLFADGGAANLESLVFLPLQHPDEMGQNLKILPEKLRKIPRYKQKFREVFGQDTITNALIGRALAAYQRSLVGFDTDFDRFMDNQITFSTEQSEGWRVFQQKCVACHVPPLFTNHRYHKSRLLTPQDQGRFRVTLDSADWGKIRTPTLRNIALTAPYFSYGQASELKIALQLHAKDLQTNLTTNEVAHLQTFLLTLTDRHFKGSK